MIGVMATDRYGWVYCLHDETNKIYRIGKTKNNDQFGGRIKSQTGYYPFPLKVVKFSFPNKDDAETHFHRTFKSKKIRGDWYSITSGDFKREVKQYKFETSNNFKKIKELESLIQEVKHWYIIYGSKTFKCEFISLNQKPNTILRLRCLGKIVRVEIPNMFIYNIAKGGNELICKALSSKGNKIIKIVFK